MQETWVQSLGREDPLEKEMATHSSILAWRIPWMEEPGGLQSTGSQSLSAEGSGAGGVQTAKASRKQSSLSGKESAQGCIPKRFLGRPD